MNDKSPQPQNLVKYRVAHVNRKGADIIFIPLDSTIGQRPVPEQAELLRTLQHCAKSAGLKGNVVLVWDKGGSTGLLAEKTVHPHIQGTTLAFVQSNINRELTVRGLNVGYAMTASGGPSAAPASAGAVMGGGASAPRGEERQRFGFVSVKSEVLGCDVYIDQKFAGNVPARMRLPEGNHFIQVKHAGYKEFSREIMVTDGADISLQAELDPEDTMFFGREGAPQGQKTAESGDKLADFQRKHRVALMTILFTDIVGSTKLKQELGDREAVRMIQWHHGIVRTILKSIPGGEEINTQGDSFFLVFVKPSDAVKFALLLQSQLRAAVKNGGYPLYDRAGIHVGEVFVEEVAGSGMNDLYGIQVDTSARVMSLAEADQILMTRFAFDNARQVLKGQAIEGLGKLAWINHGYYSLKGVEEPLEICEVGEEGLAVLRAPADSDKVHKVDSSGKPTGDTEQKTAPRPAGHVVVSTKSGQAIRPGGFSSIIKGPG